MNTRIEYLYRDADNYKVRSTAKALLFAKLDAGLLERLAAIDGERGAVKIRRIHAIRDELNTHAYSA